MAAYITLLIMAIGVWYRSVTVMVAVIRWVTPPFISDGGGRVACAHDAYACDPIPIPTTAMAIRTTTAIKVITRFIHTK